MQMIEKPKNKESSSVGLMSSEWKYLVISIFLFAVAGALNFMGY